MKIGIYLSFFATIMSLIFYFNKKFVKGFSTFQFQSTRPFQRFQTTLRMKKQYLLFHSRIGISQKGLNYRTLRDPEPSSQRSHLQSHSNSAPFLDNYSFKVDAGTIYYVSTPLGNLGDLTFRAFEVLRQVDFIASEDTRNTGLLLQKLGLPKKAYISYHKFNEVSRSKELIQKASQGYSIAVVSDAGTPGISDPGAILANEVWNQNYKKGKSSGIYGASNSFGNQVKLQSIPGPSAVISAMSVSGFLPGEFTFLGFLPNQSAKRKRKLFNALHDHNIGSVVLYESPHRLKKTFKTIISLGYGSEQILVARELTKKHEDIFRGSVLAALYYYYPEEQDTIENELCGDEDNEVDNDEDKDEEKMDNGDPSEIGILKGEFTLIIHPSEKNKHQNEDHNIDLSHPISHVNTHNNFNEKTNQESAVDSVLQMVKAQDSSISAAVKQVSKSFGIKKSKLYNAVLAKNKELENEN